MKYFSVLFFIMFAISSYASASTERTDATVTVSIPLQKYIVEQITGDTVDINVMVPAGSDPHSFAPKSYEILMLERSKLYLAIGLPFEKSMLPQISKSMTGIKISQTQEDISMLADEHEGELDPHVWTSPKAMLIVVKNTYKALVEAFPQFKSSYEMGYARLKSKIIQYDKDLSAAIAKNNKVFMVYHPAYGYLSRDYGLTQLAVEHEGKEPKARELAELISTAKRSNVQLFIISPQQSSAAAQTIAKELGLRLTVIDNLNEDWSATMHTMIEAFSISHKK